MQHHDQRVVCSRHLYRAIEHQRSRVAARQPQLRRPLQRQDKSCQRHVIVVRETQLVLEPGPMAVSKVRPGSPACMSRSSTNKAVGADLLLYAPETSCSQSKVPDASANARF